MEEQAAMADISRRVLAAIETFVVPDPHPDQLGEPLPPEWFSQQLDEMRVALIEPYLVRIEADGAFQEACPNLCPGRSSSSLRTTTFCWPTIQILMATSR